MLELLKQTTVPHGIIRRHPSYGEGDDIDILCDNRMELANQLLYVAKGLIAEGLDASLKADGRHIHLDFSREGKILTRFDIIDSLDDYKEQIYAEDPAADAALRLLEYSKHPQKTQHLKAAYDIAHRLLEG